MYYIVARSSREEEQRDWLKIYKKLSFGDVNMLLMPVLISCVRKLCSSVTPSVDTENLSCTWSESLNRIEFPTDIFPNLSLEYVYYHNFTYINNKNNNTRMRIGSEYGHKKGSF